MHIKFHKYFSFKNFFIYFAENILTVISQFDYDFPAFQAEYAVYSSHIHCVFMHIYALSFTIDFFGGLW